MSIYDIIDEGFFTEDDFQPYIGACDRIDLAMSTLRNHDPIGRGSDPLGKGNNLSEIEVVTLLPILLAEVHRERTLQKLTEIRDAIIAGYSFPEMPRSDKSSDQ